MKLQNNSKTIAVINKSVNKCVSIPFSYLGVFTSNLTSLYFNALVRQEEHWDSIETHFLMYKNKELPQQNWYFLVEIDRDSLEIGVPFSR